MNGNTDRIGNPTSSEIVKLMAVATDKKSFGKPALAYIEECNMERRLGRSISDEVNAHATSWGKLLEKRVHDLLGMEYEYCSTDTLVHPDIDCWAGSPDHIKHDKGKTVVDVKCPLTLKSFCQLVDPLIEMAERGGIWVMDKIRKTHKDGEKYYWQLMSNSVLTRSKFAELIVYMPYKSELSAIRELANNWDGPDQRKYAWISFAEDNELPYLNDGGYYENLNIIRFEVPESDKILLTEKVLKAKELLIPRFELVA